MFGFQHVDFLDLRWFREQFVGVSINALAISPSRCACRPPSSGNVS